ncbi:MAG: trypsin-like peptidase domain-containing protein, partial [Gaiellales bacterium]
ACLGSAITLGVVFAAGGFDRTTVETRDVAPASSTSLGDAGWAARVYAARIGGVVTVDVDDGAGGVQPRGAGFVVDAARGLIITNSHVVTNSSEVSDPSKVQPFSNIYIQRADTAREPASIVGFDLFDDIAVLRYDPRGLPLSAVPLGSSSSVRVGNPVAAIGAPFGQVESLSVGIVSQVGTRIIAPAGVCLDTTDAIQTDAAINPGNSGGPLFDTAGKVIGVTSQIDTGNQGSDVGSGVAFAVPIDAVHRSYDQIVASGKVHYPFIGVGAHTLTPDIVAAYGLKPKYGAQVAFVEPGSSAAKVGIQPGLKPVAVDGRQVYQTGDVIVGVAGKTVRTLADLQQDVAVLHPGDRVRIDWWHGSTLRHAPIVIGEAKLSDPDVCRASAAP